MNWPKRLKQETTDAIRYSFSSLGSLDRERFNVVDQRVLDCNSQYFPGDANRHRLAQRDVDVGARVGVHHCGCRLVLAAFQPTPGHWCGGGAGADREPGAVVAEGRSPDASGA